MAATRRKSSPPQPPRRHIALVDQVREAEEKVHSAELDALRLEAEHSHQQVQSLETTLRWWARSCGDWRSRCEAVQLEKTSALRHAQDSQEQLVAVTSEVERLRTENAKLREDLARSTTLREELVFGKEKTREGDVEREKDSTETSPTSGLTDRRRSSKSVRSTGDNTAAREDEEAQRREINVLKLKLNEAQKLLVEERSARQPLHTNIDELNREVANWKTKHKSLHGELEAKRKEMTAVQEEHKRNLAELNFSLEDESSLRESRVREVRQLRNQVEKLQAENMEEWGRRERLETTVQTLERVNKKLKLQVEELQTELDQKTAQLKANTGAGLVSMRDELHDKAKELAESQMNANRMRLQMQQTEEELVHTTKRAEQSAADVKRLRARVDELKKEIVSTQDEVDTKASDIRKLHRSLEDMQHQNDNLTVQLQHAQSRQRRMETEMKKKDRLRASQRFSSGKMVNNTTEAFSDDEDSS